MVWSFAAYTFCLRPRYVTTHEYIELRLCIDSSQFGGGGGGGGGGGCGGGGSGGGGGGG